MKNSIFPALCLALSGCATTGMGSNTGFALISSYTEALTATHVTGASKMGRSCTSNILGFIATGDASVDTAKKSGGITTVASVEKELTNILGLYGTSCTIVHGN